MVSGATYTSEGYIQSLQSALDKAGPVTSRRSRRRAPCTSSTAWARSSPSTSATPATGPTPSRDVVGWLHRVDAVFSTYRPDSDISRLRRGELRRRATPIRDVAEVLELCARGPRRPPAATSRALPDGRLDPTGLVKGWAVERASGCCAPGARPPRRQRRRRHAARPGRAVAVGIADPLDGSLLLTALDGRDFAVATSGIAERGAHILDPFTGRPADVLACATVVGPCLTPRPTPTPPRPSSWGTPPRDWWSACPATRASSSHGTAPWPTTSALR